MVAASRSRSCSSCWRGAASTVGEIDGKLGAARAPASRRRRSSSGCPPIPIPRQSWWSGCAGSGEAGRASLAPSPSVRRPALQHQGGVDDQAAPAIVESALEAAGQGCVDLGGGRARRPIPSPAGRAGRCRGRARARGGGWMAGLSMSTALATSVAATSAVAASRASIVTEFGDAEREGAPARARRGDAADARRGIEADAAVDAAARRRARTRRRRRCPAHGRA